ncbi:unnamed protein product [Alopecurus aequalis]
MDVDGQPSEAQEQTDDLENCASENEVCGICRDIVIDRGLLDGCQHMFCYTCIDNWSAIINRCPLCKIEFQHITSTPVFDNTGAGIEDNHPFKSDDDDWYVQGESNSLSFPSYYINAEAVVCLDGGDCMIRDGLVAAEDDSNLDTSIACDSCDLWYHAICVGFNPEITSEDSWLCPRCVYTEAKNKSDVILKQSISEDSDRRSTDASFSGRMSVSVADDGETALVVSMVGVNSESKDGLLEGNSNKSSEINLVGMVSSDLTQGSSELSPIHESACILSVTEHGNIPNEQLEVPQHVPSYSLLFGSKEAESTGEETALPRNSNEKSPVIKSAQLSPAASKVARLADIDMINTDAIQQVKNDQDTQLPPMQDRQNTSDLESGSEISHPAKKARLEVPEYEMHLIANSGVSSTDCHTTSIAAKAVVSDTSNIVTQDKCIPDIMSIVEGDSYMRDPGRELAKPVGRRAGDKPGLRMKKIFHKDGKESSVVVQKLQQEIREVVRDNGIGILEKDNAFDEKLLTAFRAAIGKSVDGPDKRPNSSLVRKSLLQKGKIRENLTKKLYATSTGRRRSAWHRDREVDFWKHRCSPGINPEKIETLQSVLQLLKKSSETGVRKESAEEKKAFLSRLYLADASVVPRKGDLIPLSALEGCPPLDKNSQIKDNDSKSTIKINSANSTGKVLSSSTLNKEASSRRENKNGLAAQNQQKQPAGDIKHDKRKWALEVLARKNASSIASKDQAEGTDDLSRNYPLLAKLPVDMRPQLTAGRHNKVPMSVRQAQLYRIAEHYLQRANLDVIRKCADTELAIADAINVENDIYGKSSSKSVYVNLCSQATRQSAEAKPQSDASTLTEKTEFSSDPVSQQIGTENTSISSSDVEEALGRAGLLDLPATAGQADKSELGGVPEQNMNEGTVSYNSAVEEALKRAGLFDSPPNSPERKVTTAEGNSSTVSGGPVIAQQKDTSAEDTCLVDLDSGPSKSCDSRVRDASSSLKDDDDDSSVQVPDDASCQRLSTAMSCQELKCNSEEDQKSTVPSGEATGANETSSANLAEADGHDVACEETSQTDKGTVVETPDPEKSKGMDVATSDSHNQSRHGNSLPQEGEATSQPVKLEPSSSKEKSRSDSQESKSKRSRGDSKSSTHPAAPDPGSNKDASHSSSSVYKKVEMYVKENIRPLCKSGVISVEQYRWAVGKTAEKVMKHHSEAQNANFLIKEGDKVKKLALQYVEAAQQKMN